jgi:hypothetical protein
MSRRLLASALLTGVLVVSGASPAAFADGHRHRHGYREGYRKGYHEGYERGYRRGYRAGDRDNDGDNDRDDRYERHHSHYYYSYYYHRPYPYYGYYGYDGYDRCGYGPTPPNVVVIRCRAFVPGRIDIPVHDSAVWSWRDDGVAHTVTADDGSFDSGPRRYGEFRLVFDHPGTFHYFCRIHPSMVGTVVVTP